MFFRKLKAIFETLCYTTDFFKTPFSFNFTKKEPLISIKFGTLISIMILFYLFYQFLSSNMIQKTNPSVINQKIFQLIRPKISMNNKNFELAIGIFDLKITDYYIDPTIYDIKISFLKRKFSEKEGWETINASILDFHVCNSNDFPLTNVKTIYKHMICLNDKELELEGYYNQEKLSYFNINLNLCKNTTSNKNHCKSSKEIEENLVGKALGLYFTDQNLNYNNFLNPISNTQQGESIYLDLRYQKSMKIFIKKFEFLNDDDYFTSNPKFTEGFSKESITTDFSNYEGNNSLATFNFFASQEIQQNIRTYQKLMDVFSNIGGSASLFISIGFFFVNLFTSWKMKEDIFSNLYEFQQSQKDENAKQNFSNPLKTRENELGNQKSKLKTETLEKNTNLDKKSPSKFIKIDSKKIKDDSFILEKYSAENINELNLKKNRKTKVMINFLSHVWYKIKNALGFHLTETNEIYKVLDEGYEIMMNGSFLYKKLQEFECLKKIILNEKQFNLFNQIKKPKINFSLDQIKLNWEQNQFSLYSLNQNDVKFQKLKAETAKGQHNKLFLKE